MKLPKLLPGLGRHTALRNAFRLRAAGVPRLKAVLLALKPLRLRLRQSKIAPLESAKSDALDDSKTALTTAPPSTPTTKL